MQQPPKVGQYLKTIPEIQAMDLANKMQLSDTIAYFKKASRYHSGSIMDSVTSSILPAVYDAMTTKLTQQDLDAGVPAKITQYVYRKVLGYFKRSPYYRNTVTSYPKLSKALQLWWGFSSKDVISSLRGALLLEAANPGFKDAVTRNYRDLKGEKPEVRLTYLVENAF